MTKNRKFFFAYNHLYSYPTRENVFFGVRFVLSGRSAGQKTKRNMLRDQHRIFQSFDLLKKESAAVNHLFQ